MTRTDFLRAIAMHNERRWLMGGVWCICVTFLCTAAIADPDLWGHTLYGLRAIDQGVLIERDDPFSYTAPGAAWTNHEWLTEYQFGWLWRTAGNVGLVAWRDALVLIVFAVAACALRRGGASLPGATLLLILNAECLSSFVIFIRPQLATFALFAVFLYILRGFHDCPENRSIWLLPPLMALWVNLHGGFLAGIGLIVLFGAAEGVRCWRDSTNDARSLRRFCTVGALAIAATFANPYGAGLHEMLWHHLGTPQFVREWQPLWNTRFSPVYCVPFLLTGLAACAPRRWKLVDALVLLVVGWQAAVHLRHVALFSIATLVLLPGPLSAAMERLFPLLKARWGRPDRVRLRIAATGAAAGLLVALQVRSGREFWRHGIGPLEIGVECRSHVPGMPLRAVTALNEAGVSGNLVTDYGWGQFVLWHMHPETRVAFDGRYRTVFPASLESEFLALQRARPGFDPRTAILDDYPTQLALVPAGSGMERYLASRSDWQCVYADDQASVYFARRSGLDPPDFGDGRLRVPEIPRWAIFPGGPASGTGVAGGGDRLAGAPRPPRSALGPDPTHRIPGLTD